MFYVLGLLAFLCAGVYNDRVIASDLLRRGVTTPTGCIEWSGARQSGPRPYGRVNVRGANRRVHRVVWELLNGPIPATMEICHHCDNPPCFNPDHLYLGSRSQNMADSYRRTNRPRGSGLKGEDHPLAKLTERTVREARVLHSEGHSLKSIAARYSVNRRTMTDAIRGEHWRHLEDVG